MRQYPNLIEDMELTRPEQVWVTDITYLSTRQGYKHSDNLEASMSQQALEMTIKQHCYQQALIHHSDRGLQYCSRDNTGLLEENNVSISLRVKRMKLPVMCADGMPLADVKVSGASLNRTKVWRGKKTAALLSAAVEMLWDIPS